MKTVGPEGSKRQKRQWMSGGCKFALGLIRLAEDWMWRVRKAARITSMFQVAELDEL